MESEAIHIYDLTPANLAKASREALLPSRPLANISFAIDWWRGNGNPRPFLLTNVAIHILASLAVFAFLLGVSTKFFQESRGSALLAAGLGAAIWAAHPIQVQAVNYIVQRMASLAALFTVLSTFCYIQYRFRRRPLWLLPAIVFLALGVASKENAWIAPVLWALAEYGVCRHDSDLRQKAWDHFIWLLPLVAAVYLTMDLWIFGGPIKEFVGKGYANRDFTLEQRLLTQPRVLSLHLFQVLWPLPGNFSIEHQLATSKSIFDPPSTFFALMGLVVWCGIGLLLMTFRNWRILGFLTLWVPAALIIESSLIPLEMVFEHRIYLPLVGFAGLIGILAGILYEKGWKLRWGLLSVSVVIICLLAASTMKRVPVWRSELLLYQQAAKYAPDSGRVLYSLGLRLWEARRYQEAEAALVRSLELEPLNPNTHNQLGNLYLSTRHLEKALHHYKKALELKPELAAAKLNLAFCLSDLGFQENAVSLFRDLIENRPDKINAIYGLALAYERKGLPKQAIQFWREYIAVAPPSRWKDNAKTHLQKLTGNQP